MSVIVPIYNVEKYLIPCVESIKKQTYKNLEIILVDDGSNDNCPKICDELEKTDNRIKVIHKENGGLSDARNYGIDASTGDYIGFVDSDDSVENDMFEILVSNLEKYDADVSCCRFTRVWDDGHIKKIGDDHSIKIYNGIDALKEYLYGKNIDPFACAKLYKAELIGNRSYTKNKVRFICGILGEDNPFNFEVFRKTNKVVLAGESKYNYLQKREGAITNSKISQKHIDSVYRWDEFRRECIKSYPETEEYALRREVLFYIGLYNSLYKSKEHKKDIDKVRSFVKAHLKEIMGSDICERTVKISSYLLAKVPCIYILSMKMYKKIIGEAKL